MRRRLAARCRGFLEVQVCSGDWLSNGDPIITYFHRTARDFVESAFYWPLVLETTGHDSFEPEKRWANACLWIEKSRPSNSIHEYPICSCEKVAFYIEKKSGLVQKTYLDKLCRTYYENSKGRQYQTLIAVTVRNRLNLGLGYMALALAMADPVERTRALHRRHDSVTPHAVPTWWYRDLDPLMKYYSKPRPLRWPG